MLADRGQRAYLKKLGLRLGARRCPLTHIPPIYSGGRIISRSELRSHIVSMADMGLLPGHITKFLMVTWSQPQMGRWLAERGHRPHHYTDEIFGNINRREADYLIARFILELDQYYINDRRNHERRYAPTV